MISHRLLRPSEAEASPALISLYKRTLTGLDVFEAIRKRRRSRRLNKFQTLRHLAYSRQREHCPTQPSPRTNILLATRFTSAISPKTLLRRNSRQLLLVRRATNACVSDRKSTRLNSSHGYISYAVFCLKKKKKSIVNILL